MAPPTAVCVRPDRAPHPFAAPLSVPPDTAAGVNLVGFLEGELGLGEVARKLGRGLEHAGIPFAAIPYRRIASRQEHPLDFEAAREAGYDTNVICLNADYLHTFLDDVGVEFFTGRYSIGVWFWESNVFPPSNLDALRFLDEVWIASEYVRKTVTAVADVPAHVVPLPVEPPEPVTRSRAELGLPDAFQFLFVFDFVSAPRKNPLAVVEAFTRAFEPGEGPVLIMKSINGRERKPHLLDELLEAADGRPDVHVVDRYLSPGRKEAMIASCDCYVSLHRSEGFGLTMAEAMAHGKPVIATGYSGNLDFMDDRNSYLVPYRMAPVPRDWWAYAPGAEWAEPDVHAAARLMRQVFENPTEARLRGAKGQADIWKRMSLERTSEFIAARLSDVRARRHASVLLDDARASILEASEAVARGVGASLDAGSRPSRLVRRLLVRALWPLLVDQHRMNALTLDALLALQRSVNDLSRQVANLESDRRQDDRTA